MKKIYFCVICGKKIKRLRAAKHCLSCVNNPKKSSKIYFKGTEKPCLICGKLFFPIRFYKSYSENILIKNKIPIKHCSHSCANKRKSLIRGCKYTFDSETGKRKRISSGYDIPVGKKRYDKDGYVRLWSGKEWVFEHRHKIEKLLKRKLKKGEVVHHINGKKDDNRICNLQLLVNSTHCPAIENQHLIDLNKIKNKLKFQIKIEKSDQLGLPF